MSRVTSWTYLHPAGLDTRSSARPNCYASESVLTLALQRHSHLTNNSSTTATSASYTSQRTTETTIKSSGSSHHDREHYAIPRRASSPDPLYIRPLILRPPVLPLPTTMAPPVDKPNHAASTVSARLVYAQVPTVDTPSPTVDPWKTRRNSERLPSTQRYDTLDDNDKPKTPIRKESVGVIAFDVPPSVAHYQQLAETLQARIDEEDEDFLSGFFLRVPASQLFDAIPDSLAVIRVLVQGEYGRECSEHVRRYLPPDETLLRLVKYLAVGQVPDIQTQSCASQFMSVVGCLRAQHPQMFAGLREKRNRIDKCLEGMGLQGLINYGDDMIFLCDAVRMEMTEHASRMKSLCQQVAKLSDTRRKFISPQENNNELATATSHQRLLGVHEHDVRCRLQRNETLGSLVSTGLHNQKLQSLERIIHKRTTNDQQTLHEYENYKTWFAGDDDPVVARVLLRVMIAFDHVLKLAVIGVAESDRQRDDIRVHDDSGVEHSSDCDSGDANCGQSAAVGLETFVNANRARPPPTPTIPNKSFGAVASLLQIRRLKRREQQQQHLAHHQHALHHRSLTNLSPNSVENEEDAAEDGNPSIVNGDGAMQRYYASRVQQQRQQRTSSFGEQALPRSSPSGSSDNSHVSPKFDSRPDVVRNGQTIFTEPDYKNIATLPMPDYPAMRDGGSDDDDVQVSPVVDHFHRLFHVERGEVLKQLDKLPELRQHEELQMKILFTVMVLCYRSVVACVLDKQQQVADVLELTPMTSGGPNDEHVTRLRTAVYAFLLTQAKRQHGMSNAKQVTSQIWKALYDFPSLKTCDRFNRYVLDCVNIAWHLVCGVDGEPPRYQLEFECADFSTDRHCRYQRSNPTSKKILRFIWPGLIDTKSMQTVAKAIVAT